MHLFAYSFIPREFTKRRVSLCWLLEKQTWKTWFLVLQVVIETFGGPDCESEALGCRKADFFGLVRSGRGVGGLSLTQHGNPSLGLIGPKSSSSSSSLKKANSSFH